MSVLIRDRTTASQQLAVNSDGSILSNTDAAVASTNITALNANISSGTATAASTVATAALNGASTVAIQVLGTWTGALTPQVSLDNTNWWALTAVQQNVTGIWTATIASGATGVWIADVSGFQYFRVTMTSSPTGTAAVILRTSTSPTSVTVDSVLTKGTQSPAGLSVQDLKDSGRSHLFWTVDAFASTATGEQMLTWTQSRDGAATTTNNAYTITSGKRLRITHIDAAVLNGGSGTGAQTVRLGLRFATGGSVGTGSPLVWRGALGVNQSAVNAQTGQSWDIPDGLEWVGDGTKQIALSCITPLYVATTGLVSVTASVIGFEY